MTELPNNESFPSLDDVFSLEANTFNVNAPIEELFLPVLEAAILPDKPILTQHMIDHIQNPPFVSEMIERIKAVDAYGWNRGKMGLDFGLESLNKAFNGFNTGLHLVAGGANTGKSMILLQILWNVALKNQYIDEDHPKKAFGLYFSLDDSNNELMPRIVAMDQKITINHVLFPKTLEHEPLLMKKREDGFQRLYDNSKYFAMHDASDGNTIEYIENTMKKYHEQLEMMAPGEHRLAVFIDNFHDISVEKDGYSEDNARFDYISGRLNELAIEFDAPIMCSAEFRKINMHKRPQEDDIKSTGKVTYESKGTILVYNEVGARGDQADVYWEMDDINQPGAVRKMPVFEMHIAKNKFSSYKGRQFLRFIPEMASFYEVPQEEAQQYQQMMKG